MDGCAALPRAVWADVAFNANAGLPGGAEEIRLLHFAIDGLVLDQLTPGTGRPYDVHATTACLVRRLVRRDDTSII
ncbi:hypothetical protein EV646_1166 [Kribbella antiqua]|uniref:Tetracyclin repressor-like C-terminal group 31 domain-containing protein n=1 Tax=Kribbella antiqua TaxID=2512217 RepID=A0A4R2IE45_9ACTN|nr:hypothetical protein [Kribbella antiqua]TCO40915.1 hypothetical protein EV646_1166 [Kribbella antiqua]